MGTQWTAVIHKWSCNFRKLHESFLFSLGAISDTIRYNHLQEEKQLIFVSFLMTLCHGDSWVDLTYTWYTHFWPFAASVSTEICGCFSCIHVCSTGLWAHSVCDVYLMLIFFYWERLNRAWKTRHACRLAKISGLPISRPAKITHKCFNYIALSLC